MAQRPLAVGQYLNKRGCGGETVVNKLEREHKQLVEPITAKSQGSCDLQGMSLARVN